MARGGWVYIMTDRYRGTLYIGVTSDIAARVFAHREGRGSRFCERYGLTRLVYAEQAPTIEEAIAREKALKKWKESFQRRGEEARDSITQKLLRIRRLYLKEISGSPGKRAAFEILTELPVDWELAGRLEPQPDEPYNTASQRQPDMILTAESGWTFGEHGYGPDRMAEARRAIDEYRAEEGLEPVDWSGDE